MPDRIWACTNAPHIDYERQCDIREIPGSCPGAEKDIEYDGNSRNTWNCAKNNSIVIVWIGSSKKTWGFKDHGIILSDEDTECAGVWKKSLSLNFQRW